MIDTHAHFTKKYPYSISDVSHQLDRAREHGVEIVISVMAEPQGYQSAYEVAAHFPQVYLVMGISRHLALKLEEKQWQHLIVYLERTGSKIVGVGETGLDYRFDPDAQERVKQKEVFAHQIELALQYDLPLVIHSGKAMDEVLDILKINYSSNKGGVIHFFTGDLNQAERALEMGFYLSFALPLLTNRKMQKVCSEVPLQWILTETDSPFLKSPKGWITPISEPACVVEVVKKIAEIKNMSFEKVASATSQNAAKLFGIPR